MIWRVVRCVIFVFFNCHVFPLSTERHGPLRVPTNSTPFFVLVKQVIGFGTCSPGFKSLQLSPASADLKIPAAPAYKFPEGEVAIQLKLVVKIDAEMSDHVVP